MLFLVTLGVLAFIISYLFLKTNLGRHGGTEIPEKVFPSGVMDKIE